MKLDSYTLHTSFQMDYRYLNMKDRTLYLLGGNIEKSSWSWYREEFLKSLKVQMQKEKFNNLTTIKLGTFVHPKAAPGSVTYKGKVARIFKALAQVRKKQAVQWNSGLQAWAALLRGGNDFIMCAPDLHKWKSVTVPRAGKHMEEQEPHPPLCRRECKLVHPI